MGERAALLRHDDTAPSAKRALAGLRARFLLGLEKRGLWTGIPPDPSAEPRFLFIHIPKNGGVTIRRALALKGRVLAASGNTHKTRSYTRAVRAAMAAAGEHPGLEHARLRDVSLKVRAALRPVALIRNPWARVVSRFTFAMATMESGSSPAGYAARDFEAFLEERHVFGGRPYYWHRAIRGWYPQLDYVLDEEGRIGVDLLRLEHFDAEVGRYFALEGPLERRNVTGLGRLDYRSFYTPRTIALVADWYARDIEAFGFDFDTPARRNCLYTD